MNKNKKPAPRAALGEGPIRVLLAEDEESFVDALVIGLTNEGFRVVVARDGVEALRLYEETDPDILLLDLMLPKMSGIDVCRAIRTRSRVPIIMVTAQTDRNALLDALEAGAEEFLTKPVNRAELWLRVRNLMRLKEMRDLLDAHNTSLEREVSARTAELQQFRTAMD